MAVTPDTDIRLINVPIEIDNKNQLTFANVTAQTNYFLGIQDYQEMEDCSYQRHDSVIVYDAHIDSLLKYNYVMYKNNNYKNKWFYAFIVDMEYVADGTTNIYIETDVFQTWQFDIIWKQSFIEREMIATNEDSISANLIPESFEIGEPIQVKSYTVEDLTPLVVIAYAGDELKIEDTGTPTTWRFTGGTYNGIPNYVMFIVGTEEIITQILFELNSDQRSQNIMDMFTIPKLACPIAINNATTKTDYVVLSQYEAPTFNFDVTDIPETIDGYTPKNKKLLQFPYRYFGFAPSSGNKKIFKFEDFYSDPAFKIVSEISPNPQVNFIPYHYKGRPLNMAEYGTMAGYPTLSWRTDYFNAWIAQNHEMLNLDYQKEYFDYKMAERIDIPMSAGSDLISALSTLDIGKAFSSGAEAGKKIAVNQFNHEINQKKMVGQITQAKLMPDSGTLGSSAATMMGAGLSETPFFVFNIKRQYAEIIDKYWDLYGYITNKVKTPNLNNRPNWNYVKTLGANIVGNIPQSDVQKLKAIFDNGVTLWHNSATFLDYSQNNR